MGRQWDITPTQRCVVRLPLQISRKERYDRLTARRSRGEWPGMEGNRQHKWIEAELRASLTPKFPGMTIEVAHGDRWKRMCVTFRWSGFAELLPEERFHSLVEMVPARFRRSHLQGFVWLELAPDETVDAYLQLPRSEDVKRRTPAIYGDLLSAGFFDALDAALGPRPKGNCLGGFLSTEAVLSAGNYSAAKIWDAKLLFIGQGVYCDCQVLETVRPKLAQLDTSVA